MKKLTVTRIEKRGISGNQVHVYFNREVTQEEFKYLSEVITRGVVCSPIGIESVPSNLILNTVCSVCGQPQFDSPSGVTCPNGHGGAEGRTP